MKILHKLYLIAFSILVLMLSLSSCQKSVPEPIAVKAVSLNAESMELTEGESTVLIATVSPKNAENKTIIWSSSNISIATVDDGKVTALKEGKAIITAKTDDGGKTATCDVTIKSKTYHVESISLDKTSAEMTEGEELTLTATITPDNATNKNVTWSSNDESIATVSADGKVKAITAGTVTITAKTEDGGKVATCKITVNAKVYPVESISLDKTSAEMTEGEELTLTATITPDNATNKNITWSSSDESVATVSADGKVKAMTAGTVTITAKTEDGDKVATCKITINAKVYPVESISLDKTSAEMTEGEELTLTATITPDNATNKNVTWSSNDESIATVSADGKVKAITAGTVTITAKTEDGGKTATCRIDVNEPPIAASLTLSSQDFKAFIYKNHNKRYEVSVTASPSDAITEYEWSSSDTRVAVVSGVNDSALIYTEDYGRSTITVIDKRSGLSASLTISTIVEDFAWNIDTQETLYGAPLIKIPVGEEYQLKYSCSPSHATKLFSDLSQFVFYNPTYVTEYPECVSISEDGLITGISTGTIGIKPTGRIVTADGTGRIYIQIIEPKILVESISISMTSAELTEGEDLTLTVAITPDNATNKNITWSSSDESVATISADGKVKAIKAGTATITAKTEDGGKTATCKITIKQKTLSGGIEGTEDEDWGI